MIWRKQRLSRRNRVEAMRENGTEGETDALAQARLGRVKDRSRVEADAYPEPPPPPKTTAIRRLFWGPDELASGC